MNDTATATAPAAPALSPASLGLPMDDANSAAAAPAAASTTAAAPVAGAETGAASGNDAGAGHEGSEGAAGAPRKTPEEAFAELDQRALKVHKSLAATGERRRVALDWLDPQRDRVRLALGNVRMMDADVDALIADYVTTALAASKGV